MRVKEILSDVQLVIAVIEVELNGELRTSPSLGVQITKVVCTKFQRASYLGYQ